MNFPYNKNSVFLDPFILFKKVDKTSAYFTDSGVTRTLRISWFNEENNKICKLL